MNITREPITTVFRMWYWCQPCDNRWEETATEIGGGNCPGCHGATEPYRFKLERKFNDTDLGAN